MRRLDEPVRVIDRGIFYLKHYELGFGQALSQSFTRASQKILGYSNGLHGLRHSYAQERMQTLLKHQTDYESAKRIVSQELGHFRPAITNCYLR